MSCAKMYDLRVTAVMLQLNKLGMGSPISSPKAHVTSERLLVLGDHKAHLKKTNWNWCYCWVCSSKNASITSTLNHVSLHLSYMQWFRFRFVVKLWTKCCDWLRKSNAQASCERLQSGSNRIGVNHCVHTNTQSELFAWRYYTPSQLNGYTQISRHWRLCEANDVKTPNLHHSVHLLELKYLHSSQISSWHNVSRRQLVLRSLTSVTEQNGQIFAQKICFACGVKLLRDFWYILPRSLDHYVVFPCFYCRQS